MKRRTMKDRVFWCILIVVPLLAGLLTYLLFRPEARISFFLSQMTGIEFCPLIANSAASRFLKNFFCDMLWAFSFTSLCSLILGQKRRQLLIALGLSILFEAAVEFSQKAGVMTGTFDAADIILEILASGFAVLLIFRRRRRISHEEEFW